MSRLLRPGWIVVYIIAFAIGWWMFGSVTLHFDSPLVVEEGDTLSRVLDGQGWLDSRRIQRAAAKHGFDPSQLAVGTYESIVGEMSVEEFYDRLEQGPGAAYEKITVLEGWSMYDTDALLAGEGWIRSGDYVDYVTDPDVIRQLRSQYAFLEILPDGGRSLEGFLYPETYYVDGDDPILAQLVKLQLDAFEERIWLVYGNALLDDRVWQVYDVSPYELLTMASVVLKEERHESYQPLVAGVFLNRLKNNMRLDADITLCYGLEEPYESCTPSQIVRHLSDASNPYNTRAVIGIPPTPISSLTPGSVQAVVGADDHEYLYYLHDSDGVIHPAKTDADHVDNKRKYLQ